MFKSGTKPIRIGVLLCALLALVGCSGDTGPSTSSDSHQSRASTDKLNSARFNTSMDLAIKSATDANDGNYQRGYDEAVAGLSPYGDVTKTGAAGTDLLAVALLVEAKALNEHHLPQGDSIGDMHSAGVMFAYCVQDNEFPESMHTLCSKQTTIVAQYLYDWGYREP